MKRFDREELAWAAGFFDGEGCTTLHKWGGMRPRVTIGQVDREVLDRFKLAVGRGNVRGPYKKKTPRHQKSYIYDAYGFEKSQAIMCMLWNWLGSIKKEQFKKAMTEIKVYYSRPHKTNFRLSFPHKLSLCRDISSKRFTNNELSKKYNVSERTIRRIVFQIKQGRVTHDGKQIPNHLFNGEVEHE